jgi:hypothetical protein
MSVTTPNDLDDGDDGRYGALMPEMSVTRGGLQYPAPPIYRASIEGPNGLDVSIAGPADLVAAQLHALADILHKRPAGPVFREDHRRDGKRW